MDKTRMESVDITAQNIERIGALFPNCITETKGEDGKLKKAINFDLLRQMLSGDIIGGGMKLTSLHGLAKKPLLWRRTSRSVRHCVLARKKA